LKIGDHRARHHSLAAQDAFGSQTTPATTPGKGNPTSAATSPGEGKAKGKGRGEKGEKDSKEEAKGAGKGTKGEGKEGKADWKSKETCRSFLQGKCSYGERCRFVHNEAAAAASTTAAAPADRTLLAEEARRPSRRHVEWQEDEDVFVTSEGPVVAYCKTDQSFSAAETAGVRQQWPGLARLPGNLVQALEKAPASGFNSQTLIHIAGRNCITLLDNGATTSSIPEELVADLYNRTAAMVQNKVLDWEDAACPIKCFEDFSADPRRIEGLAKDQPITVTHTVILRVMFVPIGALAGPVRAIRMKILPNRSPA
jgi:hypothetical protein